MLIEVAYSPAPGQVDLVALELPDGACVRDALVASGLPARHGLVLDDALRTGIWGRAQPPHAPLRERDRVEIYRPLRVDPKEARRQRYQRHREKTARR
jgi:putative ubiquitin-RnfH superfamily antitoxin RatB of RatAB toxin-antitoxin module